MGEASVDFGDALPPSGPDDLVVSQLYEAAAGLLPWPTALTALSHAFGAMVVQYVSFDNETGRLILCEQPEGMAVDAVLDYIREYNAIDPHAQHMKALPLGTCFDTEDVFPARRMATHRFYREFWAPYGVRGMIGGKIDEGENHYSCIGIVRHKDSPGYSATDLALAARYVHHLTMALKIARHVRALQVSSRVGFHLMQHAERPMMLLGTDRRLLFANTEGRTFIDRARGVVLRRRRLHALVAESDRALGKTIARLAAEGTASDAGVPPARRAALRIEGASGAVMLCTLWNLDPDQTSNAFGDETTILLSIAYPLVGHAPDHNFVAAMLDLTPAEARLASELVTGLDLAEIALGLGVSINTVRSQLRSIYAKTGTSRQAELVRLVSRACAP